MFKLKGVFRHCFFRKARIGHCKIIKQNYFVCINNSDVVIRLEIEGTVQESK